MYNYFSDLIKWYNTNAEAIYRSTFIIIAGFIFIVLISFLVRHSLKKRFSPQGLMLLNKFITYFGFLFILIAVFKELNFQLSAILGAAGIAGISLGLGAQTCISNIISGFFVLWEKPFKLGDLIKIDSNMGFVFSMDLMSVYLRTFDNQLIRIPNEIIIKSSLSNITRFPIRRMDIKIGVAYKEDIDKVIKILKAVADENPYCLDEPEPVVIFQGFGDSALEFLLGPWFIKEHYIELRNSILKDIKNKFDEEDIEIPFPHRTLYTGNATRPFPIEIVSKEEFLPSGPPAVSTEGEKDLS
jgi:small-conductance mechanosensitive channel